MLRCCLPSVVPGGSECPFLCSQAVSQSVGEPHVMGVGYTGRNDSHRWAVTNF